VFAITYGWPDWFNLGANVAAAAIALLGFALAIYELRRTRGAAEATRLLTLAQSLRSAERDLDESLPNKRLRAIRALNDWRAVAADAYGILEKSNAPPQLLQAVAESRQLAASCKSDLQTDPKMSLATTTHKVRSAVALVADDVAQFFSGIG
jgi:hypothetical protein